MGEKLLSKALEEMSRRRFLEAMGVTGLALAGLSLADKKAAAAEPLAIGDLQQGEDVFAYIARVKGGFDQTLYQQVIGAANAFKEAMRPSA